MRHREALLRTLRVTVGGEEAERLVAARDAERIGEAADWLHSRGSGPPPTCWTPPKFRSSRRRGTPGWTRLSTSAESGTRPSPAATE